MTDKWSDASEWVPPSYKLVIIDLEVRQAVPVVETAEAVHDRMPVEAIGYIDAKENWWAIKFHPYNGQLEREAVPTAVRWRQIAFWEGWGIY